MNHEQMDIEIARQVNSLSLESKQELLESLSQIMLNERRRKLVRQFRMTEIRNALKTSLQTAL